jgi:hypothetical protein
LQIMVDASPRVRRALDQAGVDLASLGIRAPVFAARGG